MNSPFAALPAEFADFAALCAGGGVPAAVTVTSVHPDTGATLATAADVPAVKRSRRRQPFGAGAGGDLPADQCRFLLLASAIGFTLKERDQITGADGVVWCVDERGVELIAFGAIYTADVSLKR